MYDIDVWFVLVYHCCAQTNMRQVCLGLCNTKEKAWLLGSSIFQFRRRIRHISPPSCPEACHAKLCLKKWIYKTHQSVMVALYASQMWESDPHWWPLQKSWTLRRFFMSPQNHPCLFQFSPPAHCWALPFLLILPQRFHTHWLCTHPCLYVHIHKNW